MEGNGCPEEAGAGSKLSILVTILKMQGSSQSCPGPSWTLPTLVGTLQLDERVKEIRETGMKQVPLGIIYPKLTSRPGNPSQPGAGILLPTAGLPEQYRSCVRLTSALDPLHSDHLSFPCVLPSQPEKGPQLTWG